MIQLKQLYLFILFYSAVLTAAPSDTSLNLNITFPARYDTFSVDQLRITGRVPSGARVFVNDQKVSVFPQGSFVTRVALQDHLNQIIIQAYLGLQSDQNILYVYRQPDLKTSPTMPLTIEHETLTPRDNIWAVNGDMIPLEFKGSPGANAACRIEKMNGNIPMLELPTSQTGGIRGIYHADVTLKNLPPHRPLGIKYTLETKKTKRTAAAAGQLIILSDTTPVIGQTRHESLLHTASASYSPLTRCSGGVHLHITGRINNRYKIKLSPAQTAYISCDDVTLLPSGTPLPRTAVSAPTLRITRDWIELRLSVEQAVPFQLESDDRPVKVVLTLYGAHKASHWYRLAQTDIVKRVSFSHPYSHVCECTVTLNQEYLWGYQAFYEGNVLRFRIRRTPTVDPQHPLAGLTVAVDPGHGGDEQGAVSPYGFTEKDINLLWALQLTEKLMDNGAKVVLTRSNDTTVSLRERLNMARASDALFFLSLHNNAVGAGSDPTRVQGTSTYFSLYQNEALCSSIFSEMLDIGFHPYGEIYNMYFLTGAPDFLVSLLEGDFLTNPNQEIKLADKTTTRQMADAVYQGLITFLKKRLDF
ncbi:MAG: N-acetylmuramoyl-L-alanine amidase [candidate division KSB1 bacterium]|nr:N-acetylmuramoyl-L-alanine amidase [candidate division KSB1 bacterium]